MPKWSSVNSSNNKNNEFKQYEIELNRRIRYFLSKIDASQLILNLNDINGTLNLSKGGTGASLSAPAGDRIMFYDLSEVSTSWLDLSSNFTITGTTLELITKFGDISGGNYTEAESDGTLVFNGDATVFDDENGSSLQLKTQGAGVSVNATENTLDYTTGTTLNEYSFDNYQFKHARKLGTDIDIHIHWRQKEANVPNFLIKYRWQINGTGFVTAWTNLVVNTEAFTYDSSGDFTQICGGNLVGAPVGDGISGILQIQVYRDAANASGLFAGADPYTQTANILFVDVHFEKDMNGSRLRYVK